MKSVQKIKLGISIGDLNGIGSEIVLKTFDDSRMLDFCTPVIFASVKTLNFFKKHFDLTLNFQGIDDATQAIEGKINVVNVWKENVTINFGEEDPEIGKYAFKSLQAATAALKNDHIDVLVTAPINKNTIQSEEFNFPGHTDYLAQELNGKSLMFMITDSLKVGLLTDHVALKDIALVITPELIKNKIEIIRKTLQQDFRISKPKIAVLGINPHSGDNGLIGQEDETILKPTLQQIREEGHLVYGPFAADSFFGSKNHENFDAVVASYHDQGLIPFKTLSFGEGVNFTAGLSKVRTSPDHGTAFEIAGKNLANINSFKEAVFKALEIFKTRKEYKKLTRKPLNKQGKRYKQKLFIREVLIHYNLYLCTCLSEKGRRPKKEDDMRKLAAFAIPFVGLKQGSHGYEYQVDREFFDQFGYDDFNDAEVKVKLVFDKKPTFMELTFSASGVVNVDCDLTNEPYDQTVDGELRLVVKFGDERNEDNEELLIIPHGEYEINVAQYIYEMIVLAIPLKRVHPGVLDGTLESEVLDKLEELSPKEGREFDEEETEEEIDPRWNKLKNLLNDK